MKKFLSLVLALVMTMSLVTVSAGAKDFSDDDSITYQEAVDVISEIGVVDGYTGGDFKPTDVLTRGAAAKIICNLILGPTTASALSASSAPFKDVPVSNTFAGYITYCAQEKIINGYSDGTFRPTATLSGNAFMKMLLGALGYDSAVEGYTGPNWSVAVIKQAAGIGLDDGNDEFVGSKAVTRQEAALYAFNMLQMVEYDAKKDTRPPRTSRTTSNTDGNIDGDAKSSARSISGPGEGGATDINGATVTIAGDKDQGGQARDLGTRSQEIVLPTATSSWLPWAISSTTRCSSQLSCCQERYRLHRPAPDSPIVAPMTSAVPPMNTWRFKGVEVGTFSPRPLTPPPGHQPT